MKPFLKIPLIYLVVSGIWILASDRLVEGLATTPAAVTQLQTYKGWFFVVLSAFLIFFLTRDAFLREQREGVKKRELFKGTMRGSYHILLNYLNQMQLIHLEAERSTDFDKELLKTAEQVSKDVVEELHHLETLDVADSSDIERFIQQQMIREQERGSKADS
jgi:hypothetical protein